MTALILQMTVYLTITSAIILIFKRLFKNKLSAKWQVWIWAVLLLRFVIPQLPQSEVSVFNVLPVPDAAVWQTNTEQTLTASTEPITQETHIAADITANASAKPAAKDIAAALWCVGAIGLLMHFIITYCICQHRTKGLDAVKDKAALQILDQCRHRLSIKRNIRLVCGEGTPMLIGLVKPKIILPEGYNEGETRDIITHELCHLKNGDIFWLWLAIPVLCCNWFNPLMWYSFFTFRRDIEVYCDSCVLEYTQSKKAYAELLVKTALSKNRFVAGTTSLQNGENEIERRIKYMAYFKKPKLLWSIAIAVIAVGIFGACLTNSAASCKMSKEKTTAVAERMVGSIMADLAYADEEKAVFYYTDGIYVYDIINERIENAFDLSKLNCSPHQQGSFGLQITVTADGKSAYLINYGLEDEIRNFDNYILNLENGRFKTTSQLKADMPFTGLRDTLEKAPDAKGWYSIHCAESEGSLYYLTTEYASFGYMKLVIKSSDGSVRELYPFHSELNGVGHFSPEDIKEIKSAVLIAPRTDTIRLEDESKLSRLEKMLSSAQRSGASGCSFDAMLVLERSDGKRGYIILATDSCSQYIGAENMYYGYKNASELLLMFGFTQWQHNSDADSLYNKVSSYLAEEFQKRYSPFYEIIDLQISHWEENGNEAKFFYTMTHKNYDKDPDTVPYIKEAKERGEYIYETYKKEYLEPKTGTYDLKAVLEDGKIKLYANVAGKGEEWLPFDLNPESKPEYHLVAKDDNRLFEWPCPGFYEISQRFSGEYNHRGVDIKADKGSPVVSATEGTVIETGFYKEHGNYVKISDGKGITTFYAHLDKIVAEKGTKVGRNQVIATVGETGFATGPHLHFEITANGQSIDPEIYF